ncbi:DEAD/DEAH box helicase [Mycolicibacterium sp. HK-90]|uniref:DEAD/DEAH box helicase n=1 Tax=Mycolicibacterium sp. HK-90 TaxID=3056937 RepID=UPI002659B6DB|nr:AAA domain-containing protein [Mycolicibacterium sp. HK-90]WKG04640.1 AAA domain-containing protein [Mycolicibacterium sp. HK-90]
MKLNQIACVAERTLNLRPVGTVDIPAGRSVRLSMSPTGVTVRLGEQVVLCERPDALDAEWLEFTVGSEAYIAELLTAGRVADAVGRQIIVRVLTFDGSERWPDGRMLGVDETTIEDVNRFRDRKDESGQVVDWLTHELTLTKGEPLTVLAAGGGHINDNAFRIVGASIVADIRMIDDRLIISRITQRPQRVDHRLVVARGETKIVDATRMGRLSLADKQEIRRLAEADNAYLAIWEEYNGLEREMARQAARDIGWADYDRFHIRGDGTLEFDLVQDQRSDALRARIGTETVGLEAGSGVAFNDDNARTGVIGDAWMTRGGTVRLRPDKNYEDGTLPDRGSLSGAYTLDKIRISRRESAQEQIARGETAPARQLGLILADQPPDPVGRVRRHAPLSRRVRAILGGEPTDAQVEAIDLAINSRDVVLIQGPPGTGKTRVIAAIQARLAELHKDAPALDKRVLLTSYQHDAVANLVLAADDGNLPPVKLGRAAGTEDDAYLLAWTNALQERLEKRYENVPSSRATRARRALVDRRNAYREQAFDVHSTVDLLEWVADQPLLVGSEVAHEARKLAKNLARTLGASSVPHAQAEVARLARRLRSTPESYADDGALSAQNAWASLPVSEMLSEAELDMLEAAARGQDACQAAENLGVIKRNLLDGLLNSRARASVVATMPAVEALLERASQSADREVELSTSAIDLAVERFRDAVEHQSDAITKSLKAHTRALAATCQQSVSGVMRAAQTVPFDTVIVDEAARANPLDLMVPLSMARERVILVGDHRQLPQLLDDSLVPKLSARHDQSVVSTVLNRSMFERLFVKLRECERVDGTKRVVTLDRQFRTHPILGSFLSQQFYAPFGEHLTNGNPDSSAFVHGLERYGESVCGWIDVPASHGSERAAGTSICRPPEADVIVEELAAGLRASDELTFGVITFYSGQRAAIWQAMSDVGLALRSGTDFELNPSVPWLKTRQGLPRVRIGSVDAFQGREFDVVFLSTTRSSKASKRNRFGFLVLPNRLCVAMSRQRKLLIAVGDAAQMTSPEGREAVPALAAFHDLTGGAHGFRRTA